MIGQALGPYEVLAKLGAGGMGEVFRARDTRLGRDVAIKILPGAFAFDAGRLARFEQEARATAALNHPGILAIFDIGTRDGAPFIVSELLQGETLRARLTNGAVPVRKTIDYGVQIARGLAAAHERGIVHRDLKPENLFITSDGRAKILDFGLAKLHDVHPVLAGASDAPTLTPGSTPGVVLGTIGYMSPEQVRGLAADHRSDIFALGAVLYEMLTGRRAFDGETAADRMTAILNDDRDFSADAHVPPSLARIVSRCLEKNPAARFQSASDLAFALEAITAASNSSQERTVAIVPAARRRMVAASAAAIAAVLAGSLLYLARSADNAPLPHASHSSILPPPGTTLQAGTPASLFALSPDGRRLAVSLLDRQDRRLLWIQNRQTGATTPIQGSDGALYPFWSPDSRWVAFMAGGELKKVDVSGGMPLTVAPAPNGLDGAWGADDVIVYAANFAGHPRVLWRVSAAGGQPVPATTLDESVGENRHTAPWFLPDGRRFLYFSIGSRESGENDPRAVVLGDVNDRAQRSLMLRGGSNAKYANGHLLFMRGQTLFGQGFDPDGAALHGEAVAIAQGVATSSLSGQVGAFSVSQTGVLTYLGGATNTMRLVWVDRSGREISALGDAGPYDDLELSPDGGRLLVSLPEGPQSANRDVWVFDLARRVRSRLTFSGSNDALPFWSPNAQDIVYASNRGGGEDIYSKPASGAGEDVALLQLPDIQRSFSISADGRFLLYEQGASPATDLWVQPLFGDRKPVPFLRSVFAEDRARFSPDGRWVVYNSNESGTQEVYVTSFPQPRGKWQVSTAGGAWARWSRDGRQIYYDSGSRLMSADVHATGAAFDVGEVRPLFDLRIASNSVGLRYAYDVTADGQRFIVARTLPESSPAQLTLVVNWPALVAATAPSQ